MSIRIRFLWALMALLLLAAGPASAAPVRDKHVEAELVSELTGWKPGATQWVGVRLAMDEHWHTYWQNPGDSGLPTEVTWKLPEGFQAGPLQWPYPQRIELAGLVSLAYEGTVLLPAEIRVPATARPGDRLTLQAQVKWLACKEECIPGKAALELTLPVVENPPKSAAAADFERTRGKLPRADGALKAQASLTDRTILLDVTLPSDLEAGEALEFYPTEGLYLDLAAPQKLIRTPAGPRLELVRATADPEPPKTLKGVLVRPGPDGWALELDVPVQEGGAAAPPGEVRSSLGEVRSLGVAVLFAFFGGLVLNLMPCVFPVLSLKVMSFMEHGAHGRGRALRQALVFTLGVLVSFWLLAGGLLALRAGGQQLGWGFQLQSPTFVVLMGFLFFLLGLNLLGVFEVGLGLTRLGEVGASGSGSWNSFLGGVLATLVATPCTAPFMGSALGYSLTQPAWVSLLVFTALALGMASPYVVLAAWPALLGRLPRPGAWMETFKQALSFPLFMTVVFFAWVLDRQAGPEAAAAMLAGLVLLALAGWIHGRWGLSGRPLPRFAAAFFLVAALAVGVGGADRLAAAPAGTVATAEWEAWSQDRVDSLLAEGKPVFLDFTAAWCLSCQVNERVALAQAEVQQAFRDRGVVTLKADWTNRDEAITRALASFGRSGVPLYVLYSGEKGAPPRILPEVLTPGIVLEALGELPTRAN